MNSVFCLRPQTPGGARPRSLASSHKLGRPVGLASPGGSVISPASSVGGVA